MKNRLKGKFTTVLNDFVENPNLSAKAKGIYLYLMSKPSDWEFYETEIQKHFTDKKDSIRTGIKELIDNNYLVRIQRRLKGQFSSYEWILNPTEDDLRGLSESGLTESGFSALGKSATNKTNNNKTDLNKTNNNIGQIPDFKDFLNYALEKKENVCEESVRLKYDSWIENGWKTGKDRKIKNWKSSLLNTIPYLKEKEKKVKLNATNPNRK